MPRTLSRDLRKRIVHWRTEEGYQIHEIAQLAGCCDNTVYTILKIYRESGELYNTNATPYSRPRFLNSGDKSYIISILKAMPSLFLDEIQDRLWQHRHVDASLSTISRALRGMGMSSKKVTRYALQQNNTLRAVWVAENGDIPREYIVWLDESGIQHENYQRDHGWSFLGQACQRRAVFLRGERFSVLPAVTVDGVVAVDIFKGSVNREMFVKYLKEDLAPVLTPYPGPRSVVILDNASIHHDEEIRAIIEDECGARLVYLPPYSPDYNPAEQAFSFIKSWLKRHEDAAVNDHERWWLIHAATQAITDEMAAEWITNCGYD